MCVISYCFFFVVLDDSLVVVLGFAFDFLVDFLVAVEDFFLVVAVFFDVADVRFFRVGVFELGPGGIKIGRGVAGETRIMRVPSFTSKRGFPEDVLALRGGHR